jgi:hypothetical protein
MDNPFLLKVTKDSYKQYKICNTSVINNGNNKIL